METSALPFAGTPVDARAAAKKRRLIAAAAVGNALEFYDFTVYSFFALLIASKAQDMLYGLTSYDPLVLVTSTSLLALVAFGAGLIPALRASHVSPMTALRNN